MRWFEVLDNRLAPFTSPMEDVYYLLDLNPVPVIRLNVQFREDVRPFCIQLLGDLSRRLGRVQSRIDQRVPEVLAKLFPTVYCLAQHSSKWLNLDPVGNKMRNMLN